MRTSRVLLGLVDGRVEPAVGTQAVLIGDTVRVFQDLWLRAMRVIPVRLRVSGEGVLEVNENIGGTALKKKHEARGSLDYEGNVQGTLTL